MFLNKKRMHGGKPIDHRGLGPRWGEKGGNTRYPTRSSFPGIGREKKSQVLLRKKEEQQKEGTSSYSSEGPSWEKKKRGKREDDAGEKKVKRRKKEEAGGTPDSTGNFRKRGKKKERDLFLKLCYKRGKNLFKKGGKRNAGTATTRLSTKKEKRKKKTSGVARSGRRTIVRGGVRVKEEDRGDFGLHTLPRREKKKENYPL